MLYTKLKIIYLSFKNGHIVQIFFKCFMLMSWRLTKVAIYNVLKP